MSGKYYCWFKTLENLGTCRSKTKITLWEGLLSFHNNKSSLRIYQSEDGPFFDKLPLYAKI